MTKNYLQYQKWSSCKVVRGTSREKWPIKCWPRLSYSPSTEIAQPYAVNPSTFPVLPLLLVQQLCSAYLFVQCAVLTSSLISEQVTKICQALYQNRVQVKVGHSLPSREEPDTSFIIRAHTFTVHIGMYSQPGVLQYANTCSNRLYACMCDM